MAGKKDDGQGSLTEKIFDQGHGLADREEGFHVAPGKPAPEPGDAIDGAKVPKVETPETQTPTPTPNPSPQGGGEPSGARGNKAGKKK